MIDNGVLMGICGCFVFGDAPMRKGHANFRVIFSNPRQFGKCSGKVPRRDWTVKRNFTL